jgi:hypothetical protein
MKNIGLPVGSGHERKIKWYTSHLCSEALPLYGYDVPTVVFLLLSDGLLTVVIHWGTAGAHPFAQWFSAMFLCFIQSTYLFAFTLHLILSFSMECSFIK